MLKVSGQIVFEQPPSKLDDARLTVKLEVVSLADAPSDVIATVERRIGAGDIQNLPFQLVVETDVIPNALYNVSAHVSLHPDDDPTDIRVGDYITMQSYPVLTQENATEIEVKRVG